MRFLIQEIQRCVVAEIDPNQSGDGALIIDESAIAKKGKDSVGVKRQYAGALGKVDNCQVGVFLAYATRSQTSLIARSLYLPKEWCEDPERCFEGGIPLKNQEFKTKAEIALDLVKEAVENGIPFSFVHMDAHYGVQPWLLDSFDDMGITWFADISKGMSILVHWRGDSCTIGGVIPETLAGNNHFSYINTRSKLKHWPTSKPMLLAL